MKNRFFNIAVHILFGVSLLIIASCGNPMEPFNPKIVSQSKDETAPVIEVTSPSADSDYSQTVTVTGTITDDGTVMPTLNYSVSDALGSQSKDGVVEITPVDDNVEGSAGTFSFEFTTSEYSSDILLTLQGSDWNENESDPVTIRLVYPGSAIPSFTITPGNKQVSLSWEAIEGADSYSIYYTTDGSSPSANYGESVLNISQVYTPEDPLVIDGLANGNPHVFVLVAKSTDNSRSWISDYSTVVPLSRFTLAPRVDVQNSFIRVEWPYPTDRYEYIIYRADSENGSFANISGSLNRSWFEDRMVVEGQTYWYSIVPDLEGSLMSWSEPGEISPFISDRDRKLGFIDTPDSATNVIFNGDYAYVADRTSLEVLDISDIEHPFLVPDASIEYTFNTGPRDLVLVGDILLAPSELMELRVYDITNPALPQEIKTFNIDETSIVCEDVVYSQGWIYSAVSNKGIFVTPVSNIESATLMNKISFTTTIVRDILYSDRTDQLLSLFGPSGDASLHIYSITTPETDPIFSSVDTIALTGARDMALYDTGSTVYAYVACGTGIELVDVDNLALLTQPASLTGLSSAYNVTVEGSTLYVPNDGHYEAYDISDPLNPQKRFETPPTVGSLSVLNSYAYVANNFSGVKILDITPPPVPEEISSVSVVNSGSEKSAVVIKGENAYAACSSTGSNILKIFDIGDNYSEGASLIGNSTETGIVESLAVKGNYAFLTYRESAGSVNMLTAYDISTPSLPTLAGSVNLPSSSSGISIFGDYVYIAMDSEGLAVADISDPENPQLITTYSFGKDVYDIDVLGDYAYMASSGDMVSSEGLIVFDISSSTSPLVVNEIIGGSFGKIVLSGGLLAIADINIASNIDVLRFYDISDPDSPELKSDISEENEDLFPTDINSNGNFTYYLNFPDSGDASLAGLRVINSSNIASAYISGSVLTDTVNMYALDVSGDSLYVLEGNRFVVYSLK